MSVQLYFILRFIMFKLIVLTGTCFSKKLCLKFFFLRVICREIQYVSELRVEILFSSRKLPYSLIGY